MTLGQQQEKFARLLAEWIIWVFEQPGMSVRFGESRILKRGPLDKGRRARLMSSGALVQVEDAVHASFSLHYIGLAADMQLFEHGDYITLTSHPAWQRAGAAWKRLDPECRWGGDFDSPDGNHLSLEWQGKA